MTPIDTTLIQVIASRCGVTVRQAEHTVQLLAEGATVPFISRYRKERTGGLDEVQVSAVKVQFERLSELEKRKETILASIDEQGKLNTAYCCQLPSPKFSFIRTCNHKYG